MTVTKTARFLSLLGALLFAVPALSQSTIPEIDIERLQLDPAATTSLVVGGGQLLPAGEFRLGLAPDWEMNPLRISIDGASASSLVENRWMAFLFGAWTVVPRLELSAQVPIILDQTGKDPSSMGLSGVTPTALGNPFVGARVGILQTADGDPFNLAFGVNVGLPVGSGAALGNGGVEVYPDLQASREFGNVIPSLEVGGLLRPGVDIGDGEVLGSELDGQAAIAYDAGSIRPEIVGRLFVPFGHLPAAGEALVGARGQPSPSFDVFALAGVGFGTLVGVPAVQVTLGAAFDGGKKPRPALPSPPAKPVAYDPCAASHPHTPEQCPDNDDDGDGILNRIDKCPLVPGLAKYQGCPIPDRDHDGIPDDEDACPDEPGPIFTHGCPDRDGDGVPDKVDACPDEPGPPANHGCPWGKKQLVVINQGRLEIGEQVHFDTAKATIQKRSYALLDQVADLILAHPEIGRIEIRGHTDDRGGRAYNRTLSTRRADAVRRYLVADGVPGRRLQSRGFGFSRPIATNATEEGRARNRRVEFAILGSHTPEPYPTDQGDIPAEP